MSDELKIEYLPVGSLKPYEKNAKRHPADQVEHIANSIREFGFRQPLVIDKDNVLVIGHGRLLAAKKLRLDTVPCVRADDLTDEQIKALRLADNKTNESEWDFDLLGGELDDIFDIDMEQFGFDTNFDEHGEGPSIDHGSLAEIFVVPPFSVLDAKQGYWRERKKQWLDTGIKSEVGRDAECLPTNIGEEYGRKKQTAISVFDPVLTEIMYKWFCPVGGMIYDCFAGGSVRGIVADKLGYKYIGIDLRQEQVDANYENAAELGASPVWHCDDSCNADKYIADNSIDMIFSCPPYFDLEVYSDNPKDISNMDYDGFCSSYRKIIDIACKKLKENRFAVFVVGDIRDKNGYYRNFVDYTKKCFNENGLQTYNEMILCDVIGTGAIRAKKQMISGRKVIKTHQNVLCFFKGDCKKIKEIYGEIDVGDVEEYLQED